MAYYRKFSPKIILLITLIVVVLVAAVSIILVNSLVHDWGFYEIFTAIGTALVVVGGVLAIIAYNAGTQISDARMHSLYPDMAKVENEYAREQRKKFPWLSFAFIIVGGIFLTIGLVGVF